MKESSSVLLELESPLVSGKRNGNLAVQLELRAIELNKLNVERTRVVDLGFG
ncbi:MAG TPA: hypothetical protein VGI60_05820 [Chthoniobacterales bacterium]|jgi:hypothetical protein